MHQSSKLIQWAEQLSAFDYAVEHVKGSNNQFADALSRLPLLDSESALPEPAKDIMLKRIAAEGITLSKVQSATEEDPILQRGPRTSRCHMNEATALVVLLVAADGYPS